MDAARSVVVVVVLLRCHRTGERERERERASGWISVSLTYPERATTHIHTRLLLRTPIQPSLVLTPHSCSPLAWEPLYV